jgi:RNA polymerase sigma-70 factor (ECF subfamily)
MQEPASEDAARLAPLIERLNAGDPDAVNELIESSVEQLRRHVKKQFRKDDRLHNLLETDDVFQQLVLRLLKGLKKARPTSARAYFGLAAAHVRNELCDLADHYFGPHGDGRRIERDPLMADSGGVHRPRVDGEADPRTGPAGQAEQAEWHQLVDRLPDDEREMFDLLYYHGLKQAAAAAVVGVSTETIGRRWSAAQVSLHRLLHGTRGGGRG